MSSPITSLLTVKVMVLASTSPETSIPRDEVLPVSDWTAKTAPGSPVPLMDFIGALEEALGVEAVKEFEPMQPGDVKATAADTSALEAWVGFKPMTSIQDGTREFALWYKSYLAG